MGPHWVSFVALHPATKLGRVSCPKLLKKHCPPFRLTTMSKQSTSCVQLRSKQTPAAKVMVAFWHAPPIPPPVPVALESHSIEMELLLSKVKLDPSQTPFPRQSITCWLLSPFVTLKKLLEQVPPESDGATFTSEVSLQYKSRSNSIFESEQARYPLQRRLSMPSIDEFEQTCTPSQHISLWQRLLFCKLNDEK